MSLYDIVRRCDELGLESSSLDELVYEIFSAKASAVNNSGLVGQVELLIEEYGEDEAFEKINNFAP